MNHIGALWEKFEKRAVPAGASDVQRNSMKRCFYGGAALLFSVVTEKTNDPKVTSEEGARFMNDIANEINTFADAVSNGKS
jgi:hypothetical protein